jgi:hypothetical protein
MKILILLLLTAAAFTLPDKVDIIVKTENVAPKKPIRRDSLPDDERLTYTFLSPSVVTIKYIDFCGLLKGQGKTYARINEMTDDGHIARTLVSAEIDSRRKLQATVPNFGVFKISIFREGAYCEGIEFDFRYFSRADMTPIHQFVHHSINCQ